MRKLGPLAALLVVLTLAVPAAAAEPETLRAKAPLEFRGASALAGDGIAVHHATDDGTFGWSLHAERATLTRWTCSGYGFGTPSCTAGETRTFTDATLVLSHSSSERQVADARASGPGTVRATDAVVGYVEAFVDRSDPGRSPLPPSGLAFRGKDGGIEADLTGDVAARILGGSIAYEGTENGERSAGTWPATMRGNGFPFMSEGFTVITATGANLETEGPGLATADGPVLSGADGAALKLAGETRAIPGPVSYEVQAIEHERSEAWFVLLPVAPGAFAPLGGDDAKDPATERLLEAGAVAATAAGVAGLAAAAWYWPYLRYAGSLLVLPLYSRIRRGEVMEHETRERIYQMIQETPGIHAHEISAKAGVGWGTAIYHLKMLEDHRLVVGERQGRYKRFFPAAGFTSTKDAIGAMRNGTTAAVAEFIARSPGCIQREVCAALGLSPSLVSWHIEKLERAELVKKVREGRTVKYFSGPMWNAVAPQATPVDPIVANN